MDWKLIIIGVALTALGGFIIWKFRKSRFNKEVAAGCFMSLGVLLVLTGVPTLLFGFLFKT